MMTCFYDVISTGRKTMTEYNMLIFRMLLEDYIQKLDKNSPDYPDVKTSLDQVALAANKANDNITKLVSLERFITLPATSCQLPAACCQLPAAGKWASLQLDIMCVTTL